MRPGRASQGAARSLLEEITVTDHADGTPTSGDDGRNPAFILTAREPSGGDLSCALKS